MYEVPETLRTADHLGGACVSCGFELWTIVGEFPSAVAGLYDDGRFPGRVILSMRSHYDHLDEVPAQAVSEFFVDVSVASGLMRNALGADRVNVAVLGNQVAHVHAHLIPRYITREPLPDQAPWSDPRPRRRNSTQRLEGLAFQLTQAFQFRPMAGATHNPV